MNSKNDQVSELVAFGRQVLTADDANRAHSDFHSWVELVAQWLDWSAPNTGLTAKWYALPTSNLCFGNNYMDQPESWREFRKAVQARFEFISQVADRFNETPTNETAQSETSHPKSDPRKVFIVHGHNEHYKESVARYTEKLGLQPIILHEQPNEGKTVIEKFEKHSDVSFAVILLTADDRGGLADDDTSTYQLRARQNVIFELGFFIAKLGRSNVCALYQPSVELPSDYKGVVFIELDKSEAWRQTLAREMKQAKLPIDMNKTV